MGRRDESKGQNSCNTLIINLINFRSSPISGWGFSLDKGGREFLYTGVCLAGQEKSVKLVLTGPLGITKEMGGMAETQWTVNVDDIPEEGHDLNLSGHPSFFEFDLEEGAWRGPVEWTGTLQRFDADVLCRGTANAGVSFPCSRCLRKVGVELSVDTVFTFRSNPLKPTKGRWWKSPPMSPTCTFTGAGGWTCGAPSGITC